MADVTPVNGQVTDAVTQATVLNVGSAPANAAGNLANASAQTFALMMENAVTAQQSLNTINAAAIAQSVSAMNATQSTADRLLSLLAALRAGTAPFPPAT